jgi:hypothetical protein
MGKHLPVHLGRLDPYRGRLLMVAHKDHYRSLGLDDDDTWVGESRLAGALAGSTPVGSYQPFGRGDGYGAIGGRARAFVIRVLDFFFIRPL